MIGFLTYLRAQVVDLSLEPLAGLLNLLLPGEEEQQVPLHLLAHVDLTKIHISYRYYCNCCSRGSDPRSIKRISLLAGYLAKYIKVYNFQALLWIRICIRIQWGPWIRIRIQKGKNDPQT
jgi:hypothetical protein